MGVPALGDTGWNVPLSNDFMSLDALAPIGGLCVTAREVPSASLNVAVAGGSFRNSWGSVVAYAGAASQAIPTGTTRYLYLTGTGTLTLGSAWPTGSFYVPLAVVVAGATTITGVTDARIVCGAVNVQSEPILGAATAGGTYGANEATMLNAVYSAVRALGLGS